MAATESPLCIVVCDAGPLIHLDELKCLDLLSDFEQVLVPGAVWTEVERHRPAVLKFPDVNLRRVTVETGVPEEIAAIGRTLSLDRGELEALQAVREHAARLLLSDDTAARLAARQLQIPVHGTLGVLLRAIRRGQRQPAQVGAILHSIPALSTLHVRQTLLDEIIREVEQQG